MNIPAWMRWILALAFAAVPGYYVWDTPELSLDSLSRLGDLASGWAAAWGVILIITQGPESLRALSQRRLRERQQDVGHELAEAAQLFNVALLDYAYSGSTFTLGSDGPEEWLVEARARRDERVESARQAFRQAWTKASAHGAAEAASASDRLMRLSFRVQDWKHSYESSCDGLAAKGVTSSEITKDDRANEAYKNLREERAKVDGATMEVRTAALEMSVATSGKKLDDKAALKQKA